MEKICVNRLIALFFKEWSIDWGAAWNCYLYDNQSGEP